MDLDLDLMMAAVATAKSAGEQRMVPLAVLLKKELSGERAVKPDLLHGQANQSKKGEDFTLVKTECERVSGNGLTTFSVFGVGRPTIQSIYLFIFFS